MIRCDPHLSIFGLTMEPKKQDAFRENEQARSFGNIQCKDQVRKLVQGVNNCFVCACDMARLTFRGACV